MPIDSFSEADFIARINDEKTRLANVVSGTAHNLLNQMHQVNLFVANNQADYDAHLSAAAQAELDALKAEVDTLCGPLFASDLTPGTKADAQANLDAGQPIPGQPPQ